MIRLLSASYRKAGLTRAEFFPLLSIIGRANRILCGMRASERDFNDMTRLTAEQKFDEPVTQIKRIKLDWEIIDNPVLSLLEQSLATYRASLAGETVSTGFGNLQLIADRTLDQLNALRARNFALADSLGQHIDVRRRRAARDRRSRGDEGLAGDHDPPPVDCRRPGGGARTGV